MDEHAIERIIDIRPGLIRLPDGSLIEDIWHVIHGECDFYLPC